MTTEEALSVGAWVGAYFLGLWVFVTVAKWLSTPSEAKRLRAATHGLAYIRLERRRRMFGTFTLVYTNAVAVLAPSLLFAREAAYKIGVASGRRVFKFEGEWLIHHASVDDVKAVATALGIEVVEGGA